MSFRGLAISSFVFFGWALIIFFFFNSPKDIIIKSSIFKGNIQIKIDEFGVGSVIASDRDGANFGLGYLHAKDRLLQLFISKAFSTGTLSESLGPDAIDVDKTILNFRFDENVQFIYDHLDDYDRKILEAYVNGINEYVNNLNFLPLEFYLLGLKLSSFTVKDVISIYKIISFSMSAQWTLGPLRTCLEKVIGKELTLEILPIKDPNVGNDLVYSKDLQETDYHLDEEMDKLNKDIHESDKSQKINDTDFKDEEETREKEEEHSGKNDRKGAGGSNSWVVHGNYTESGMPLLAGDPHLATEIPNFFYLSSIRYGNITIKGATVPGTPVYVVGRNNEVAWACTMSMVESINLFKIEKEHLQKDSYIYNNDRVSFNKKKYIIKVKNSPAETFISKHTVQGPFYEKGITHGFSKFDLISESYSFKDPFSFSWGGFKRTDSSFIHYLHFDSKTNLDDFKNEVNKIQYCGINIVFAYFENIIGSMVVDNIAKRKSFGEHLFMRSSINSSEKIDYTNFARLNELNPSKGYIVACNNKLTENSAGSTTPQKARSSIASSAIKEKIDSKQKLTVKDMMDIQYNISEVHASKEKDILIRFYEKYSNQVLISSDTDDRKINNLIAGLKTWNTTFYSSSKDALIFFIWRHVLTHDLFGSILDKELAYEAFTTELSQIFITNFVLSLDKPSQLAGKVCQIHKNQSIGNEPCAFLVINALLKAIKLIEKELGENQKYWKFGYMHTIQMNHFIFGNEKVPGLLKLIFNRELPSSGSHSSVKKAGIVGHIPSEEQSGIRMVADLSNFNSTWFTITPGQSSNILSLNYDNLLEKHEYGQYIKIGENRNLYTITINGE